MRLREVGEKFLNLTLTFHSLSSRASVFVIPKGSEGAVYYMNQETRSNIRPEQRPGHALCVKSLTAKFTCNPSRGFLTKKAADPPFKKINIKNPWKSGLLYQGL